MSKKLIGNKNALGHKHSEKVKKNISDKNKISMKGRKFTEEHKRKLSKSAKGRKLSDKTREKLSLLRKGKKFTEEHKQKISESNKKYRGKLHSQYGKSKSEESKQKMRDWWKLNREKMKEIHKQRCKIKSLKNKE